MSGPADAMARARQLLGAGRAAEAAACLRAQLAVEPGRLDALYMLGQAEIRQGRYDEAGQALEAARRLRPGHPGILHALAGVLLSRGRTDDAMTLLEEALHARPREPRLWHALGLARHTAGLYRAALEAYGQALALDPAMDESTIGRGKVLQLLGRLDEARAAFEAVLARRPGHPEAREGLAVQHELAGHYDEALALLEPDGGPEPVLSRVARARLLRRLGRTADALGLLEGLDRERLPVAERGKVLFEQGDLLDALGRYEEAFDCYREANATAPGHWSPAAHEARMAALGDRWSRPRLAALAGLGRDIGRPLFVVGMPRSGTSLVEQILARHPEVHAAGELGVFADAARMLTGADGVADPERLDGATVARIAEAWLAAAGGDGARRCVDKMPANATHLGLIQAVFPRARVVYCRRDPRDAGLSCFRQDFSGLGLAWSRDLDHIARYYGSLQVLMDHWRATLDLRLLELRYEDLVTDPGTWIPRLVEFAGLPWDEDCGRFEAGDRRVHTASHAQVRRALYGSAVGRYRDYEPWLGPLAAPGRSYEHERGQG